ncbi:hypothetical protein SODALDRAFT_329186 [Sodiomyces alkalinus F11]|uniref:DUF7707 domain-containing protein n=1 Tax=Sodiomyces alkalinus (strain CBS 110278 / VKM F-3762 / F11) TaxID=1314773 RepID=A0A3N2PKB9_SODAK|nr:hypothetical protein SODALDRAFT_329186 [Sodiomyces alkalinus F11]ROT34978.1 hypothetical protein SODALDRAFT_329186 [Sodiomyces alkalinus F11]
MPSFKSVFLAVAATVVATVSAQDYWVEPDTVPRSTRVRWCEDQRRTCPFICQQTDPRPPVVNDCDPDALNYGCICGDSNRPNMTEYSLTLPYHMCMEWGNQCVAACDDNACAAACREENPCGAQDPERVNVTSSSSASSEPTPSSTADANDGIFTGLAGSENNDDNDSAASVMEIGRGMGLAVLVSAVFGGFGIML